MHFAGVPFRLAAAALLAATLGVAPVLAHVYQYDNTTSAAIPTVAVFAGTSVYTSTGGNLTITDNAYVGGAGPTPAGMACKSIAILSDGFDTINGPVSVTVPITTDTVGNIVIKLFAPTGDNFTLVSRPGFVESINDNGADAGVGDASNLALANPITFGMAESPESETMGTSILGGTVCPDEDCSYNPDNGSTALSENLGDLNTKSKVGTWYLCAGDAENAGAPGGGGNTNGTLGNWTLNLGSVGVPPPDTSDSDCDNGTSGLSVQIYVSDTFTATSLAVGLNASHANRGDIRARLAAPDGTIYPLITQSADAGDNYDIFLIANTESGQDDVGLLDDGDIDPTAAPFFNRMVNGISGIGAISEAANGTWTLRLCDRNDNGTTGTFNRARLALVDGAASGQVCTSYLSYDWGANGQNANFTSFTVGEITVTETTATDYAGAGANNFTTSTESDGGQTGFYRLYMAPEDIGGAALDYENMGQLVTFTFSETVQDLQFSLTDNDWANADFEDILRVEGTGPSTGFVRYTRTAASGSPSFSFAGDLLEGDTGNDNTTNGGTSNYFFDRGINTLSVVYLSGNEVAGSGEPHDQLVTITDFQFCAFDFGDAPNTYGTTLASNGARHIMGQRNLYLGANRPDGESEGQPTAGTLDDTTTVGGVDDEDGVVGGFPSYVPGSGTYTVTVSATNTTGSTAYLVGYIDWNADGDFNDAGEKSLTQTVPNNSRLPGPDAPAATNFNVTWNAVPATPSANASYARFRISTNQLSVESPTGLAPNGEVEDYPITAGTLPVTVAWVETALERGGLAVRFMTATEHQNAGFRIWGLDARGERTLLGKIPSKVVDSFAPQSYELRVGAGGFVAVEIEDVGTNGKNRLHGPFAIGTTAGRRPEVEAIDWAAIRAEIDRTDAVARESALPAMDDLLSDARIARPATMALVKVREAGIHRLTYEQLVAAGLDLSNTRTARLALYDQGVRIPVYRSGSGLFGPGQFVEFVFEPALTLESPFDALELRVERNDLANVQGLPVATGERAVTEALDERFAKNLYSSSSPTDDPWYDAELLSFGSPAQLTRSFDLPDLAEGPVSLRLDGWGYSYFDGPAPDHHVIVRLNGTELASETFDGLTPWSAEFDVTGLVELAGNTLELVVPGDTGYVGDLVAFTGFEVAYRRETVALDGRFRGQPVGGGAAAYAVDGLADGPVSIWLRNGQTAARTEVVAAGGRVVVPSGVAEAWVAQSDRLLTPDVSVGVPLPLLSKRADYLILTHRAFAGELGDLVALQRSRGFSTAVIDVGQIYAAYSDHQPSAEAIRQFVAASSGGGRPKYVLLVGAASSDPYDHFGLGSISFVPTAYLPVVPEVSFSPTDEALADFDGDRFPDVPIGRLPVRTLAELTNAIDKLYAWEAEVLGAPEALLVAGASDGPGELMAINDTYALALDSWSTAQANVDDLGTAAVRQETLAAMNAGVPMVSFVGHSSPSQWDFTTILHWSDVDGFTNVGRPNLVTQWGCWNSYYVEPIYECMSGRLLRAPGVGAAGTIGAATLTSDASHRRLGVLFFQQLASAQPKRLGDAFLAAKQALRAEGGAQDAILGMALLGDPAMPLPYTSPAP